MPKFSNTTTNAAAIAVNNALDDMLHYQRKLDATGNKKQREYFRNKLEIATAFHQQALQNLKQQQA